MSAFAYDLASFIEFRDRAELARVRAITRAQITQHPNPEFRIRVEDDVDAFYTAFANDIVSRIEDTRDEGRRVRADPAGGPGAPVRDGRGHDQRAWPDHATTSHTFNMDEYADAGREDRPGRLGGLLRHRHVRGLLRCASRRAAAARGAASTSPPSENIERLRRDDRGRSAAPTACYGGIGWCGHIAFWESHLGLEFGDDLAAYKEAGPRIVELNPMTIMQNALHSFGGDWSWVPPKAATIGPAEILGARDRSFWLDGDLGGGVSWQRFIARLVAHGPVSTLVPGSILQTAPTDYTILGGVADDVKIDMS